MDQGRARDQPRPAECLLCAEIRLSGTGRGTPVRRRWGSPRGLGESDGLRRLRWRVSRMRLGAGRLLGQAVEENAHEQLGGAVLSELIIWIEPPMHPVDRALDDESDLARVLQVAKLTTCRAFD